VGNRTGFATVRDGNDGKRLVFSDLGPSSFCIRTQLFPVSIVRKEKSQNNLKWALAR
jgi:hypothetical protein